MKLSRLIFIFALVAMHLNSCSSISDRQRVIKTMLKATRYMADSVATHGGFLWRYSPDLQERAGELPATSSQVWVQPPGTPTMGLVFIEAYWRTKNPHFKHAAKGVAEALLYGQLQSGGWDYMIDFDLTQSKRWAYRQLQLPQDSLTTGRNITTLDDNTTQEALRFLLNFFHMAPSDSLERTVRYALNKMIEYQYANGAWPQRFPTSHDSYFHYYTFNDDAINDCIDVMFHAWRILKDERYLTSAKRGLDFIIASQLPEPMAGWAQQYDLDMRPATARWFEPAACEARVTSRNIRTLLDAYLIQQDSTLLRPIPAAIRWLQSARIDPHRWARFYEIGSNRPLFVNLEQQVVYEFENIRSGYAWYGDFNIPQTIEMFQQIQRIGPENYLTNREQHRSERLSSEKMTEMREKADLIMSSLDTHGRWLKDGSLHTTVFVSNMRYLMDYLNELTK